MSSKREQYRESARECIRLAQITTDSTLRQILRQHAQEWLRLAYAEQDDRFRDVLADFNEERLVPLGRPNISRRSSSNPKYETSKEGSPSAQRKAPARTGAS
jgi:hypothetical protein